MGLLLLVACDAPSALPSVPKVVASATSSTAPPTSTTSTTAPPTSTTAPPTSTTAPPTSTTAPPTSTTPPPTSTTPPPTSTTPPPTSSATSPSPTSAAPVQAAGAAVSDVGEAALHAITCEQTEAQVAASSAPRVTQGDATVYIGAQQVSGDNQDPRVVRFDGGRQTWCRDDLERSGDDGRGYGLLWSGDTLLGVFSATGNQGDASGDLRRFTGSGWLKSYADASPLGGGGPKVAVVVGLDPDTGAGIAGLGTWITALNFGKVNSATVTGLDLVDGGIEVEVNSAFASRRPDRSAADCDDTSPFPTTYTFNRSLTEVTAVDLDPGCR